jgi:hypothetical protein
MRNQNGDAVQAIPFPDANRDNVRVYLRQMKQFEAQMKSSEHQANLIIDATAVALNVPAGWALDMQGDNWRFVPVQIGDQDVAEDSNEPQ